MSSEAEALQLIGRAVLALQARQHPGRPIFYALERVRTALRQAQAALPPESVKIRGGA